MKRISKSRAVAAVAMGCTVLLPLSGCGHSGAAGGDALEQQKHDVMGGPAPDSVTQDIAAKQAKAQQQIQQHAGQQGSGQRP